MVYIRRYLSGQQATTVTIAQGAITADKIVDKAVTQPKIADDAITSDKIAPGAVESEDIKDGEVKTADIGAGAVTTSKIADGAVTTDKLEASIQGIARPLTPGVASDEIAALAVVESKIGAQAVATAKIKDGNVSAVKLAADAVETVKIKDGAVSTAKIAGGAVTETKIGTDAVTGSKILNRTVGTTEIALDGVQAGNIKDLHVTEPKLNLNSVSTRTIIDEAVDASKLATAALAISHRESFDVRVASHYENFYGIGISDKWRKIIAAGGTCDWVSVLRGLKLETPATINKAVSMDWDSKGMYLGDGPASITFRLPPAATFKTYETRELGWVYVFDKSAYVLFKAVDVAGAVPNWHVVCRAGGAITDVDTGILVADEEQVLTIDFVNAARVVFYINGVEVAVITTNIPDGFLLDPYISIEAESGASRKLYVTMMSLLQERPAYA